MRLLFVVSAMLLVGSGLETMSVNVAANTNSTASLTVPDQLPRILSTSPRPRVRLQEVSTALVVEISPGQNIQSIVAANPPGTTFRLNAGVHRLQTIRPRTGDRFVGVPGAALSGARQLTNFTRSGSYWVAAGQTQQGARGGICKPAFPRCGFPEQLFINGELLKQVGSLAEVKPPNWAEGPGEWYFDYDADAIYISHDPTSMNIETSVTPTAFEGTADDVSITGLIVEMYASPAQHGAIDAETRTGWVITDSEVRKNHGAGIRVGARAQLIRNYIHSNGQLGVFGTGANIQIVNNSIFFNNTAGFYERWEGGGAKFVGTTNLVLRDNVVRGNFGPGLWTDIANVGTLQVNQTSEGNTMKNLSTQVSSVVEIAPGDDIEAIVEASPPGTIFHLKAGVHRMQTIRPRDNDRFIGEAGAVLSGARRLTGFVKSGQYWKVSGQTQQGVRGGICQPGYPRCVIPERLAINGELLEQVGSLAAVQPPNWAAGPGQWYFDYDADTIYISYDPTWLTVETSVAASAFEPTADNVTVVGLIIEMYASPTQIGAIHADGRTGWIITDNEIRKNSAAGIRVGGHSELIHNYVHNNGQLGIFGTGDDLLVENNAIFHNNTARYYTRWEAGGAKFVITKNLVVRGNFSHFNIGPGLWTDIDNVNTLYESNICQDNTEMGIFHEISYSAIIRNNILRRNGFGYPDWIAGAGILVAASSDVEVYNNILEENADGIGAMQQNRGSGAYGPYQVTNLRVHDNVLVANGGWTGVVQDVGDMSIFVSRNNAFYHNEYHLGPGLTPFTWMNADLTEYGWQTYGQDTDSSFAR